MSKPQYTLQELKTMPYQDYLKSDHWLATRKRALWNAGRRCQVCNSEHELQAHHRTYERRGEEDDSDLTVLCRRCHEIFHDRLAHPDVPPQQIARSWRNWKSPQPASPQLKAMARPAGDEKALERRERLIVVGFIRHPQLLAEWDLLDLFAEAKFTSVEFGSLRTAIINIAALESGLNLKKMVQLLFLKGFEKTLDGIENQPTPLNEWFLGPTAGLEEVRTGLRQMLALQRKFTVLKDEVEVAAAKFAETPTEENFNALARAREEQGFGTVAGRTDAA